MFCLDIKLGIFNPATISAWVAPLINSTNMRLVWRTLRASSEIPFLCLSSSSKTTMGK